MTELETRASALNARLAALEGRLETLGQALTDPRALQEQRIKAGCKVLLPDEIAAMNAGDPDGVKARREKLLRAGEIAPAIKTTEEGDRNECEAY